MSYTFFFPHVPNTLAMTPDLIPHVSIRVSQDTDPMMYKSIQLDKLCTCTICINTIMWSIKVFVKVHFKFKRKKEEEKCEEGQNSP